MLVRVSVMLSVCASGMPRSCSVKKQTNKTQAACHTLKLSQNMDADVVAICKKAGRVHQRETRAGRSSPGRTHAFARTKVHKLNNHSA